MAAKVLYLTYQVAPGALHGALQDSALGETAPSTATMTNCGWTVGTTTPTKYSLMGGIAARRAATTFATTAQPASAPTTNDCFRSQVPYNGTFDAGNWIVAASVIATTAATGAGRLRVRLYKSHSPTGSDAVEFTSGATQTGQWSNLTTSTAQNLTTGNIAIGSAVTFVDEYLFVQFACEVDTASGSSSASCAFRANSTASIVTTPNYTSAPGDITFYRTALIAAAASKAITVTGVAAGTMFAVTAGGDSNSDNRATTLTGGSGITWARSKQSSDSSNTVLSDFWTGYASGVQTSQTFTWTAGASINNGSMTVTGYYGLSGAVGNVAGGGGSSGAETVTITPSTTGSTLVASATDGIAGTARTWGANTAPLNQGTTTYNTWTGMYTGTVTAGTPATLSTTAPTSTAWAIAAVELLPTGVPAALVGAVAAGASMTGALTTSIPLAGDVSAGAAATGSLTTSIPLGGAITAGAVMTGDLTAGSPNFAPSSFACGLTMTGALTTAIPLGGSVAASAAATGQLTTAIRLGGAVAASAAMTGALTTSIRLQAAVSAGATATGALTTSIPLGGAVAASAAAAGSLTTAIRCAGAAAAGLVVSGALTTAIPLAGAITASEASAGSLTTSIRLAGAVSAGATVTGELTAGSGVAGSISAALVCTGELTTAIPLGGAASASMTTTGSLTTAISLAGSVTASCAMTGSMPTEPATLSGDVVVGALLTGSLSTSIALSGSAALSCTLAGDLGFVIAGPFSYDVESTVHGLELESTLTSLELDDSSDGMDVECTRHSMEF